MGDAVAVDRDALGISAKEDWTDSETLANVAGGIQPVINDTSSSIHDIPAGRGTDGVVRLRNEIGMFLETMRTVIREYSDAAALLGSGQESAMANYDTTETDTTGQFDFLTSSTEG